MKKQTMLKQLHLDSCAFENIKKAVQKAEASTTGEIALAITPESTTYAFWELFAAVLAAAVVFAVLLPVSGILQKAALHFFWEVPAWYLPFQTGLTIFVVILLVFYLANIPFVDRLIIPHGVKETEVTNRSFRYFTESGVYKTAEHSGILIFVSYLERQVRIVADTGISEKIPQDLWNIIADGVSGHLKDGKGEAAFTEAVEKCGELLTEHFPAHKENPDELPDGLAVI